jgi:hypothetical protein
MPAFDLRLYRAPPTSDAEVDDTYNSTTTAREGLRRRLPRHLGPVTLDLDPLPIWAWGTRPSGGRPSRTSISVALASAPRHGWYWLGGLSIPLYR